MELQNAGAPRRVRRTWNIPQEEEDVTSIHGQPGPSTAGALGVLLHASKQLGQHGQPHGNVGDTTAAKDQSEDSNGNAAAASKAWYISWNDLAPLAAHKACKPNPKPDAAVPSLRDVPRQQPMVLPPPSLGPQTSSVQPGKHTAQASTCQAEEGPLASALKRQGQSLTAQLQPVLPLPVHLQPTSSSSTHTSSSSGKPGMHSTGACSSSLVMASLSLGIGPGAGHAAAAAAHSSHGIPNQHGRPTPVQDAAASLQAPVRSALPGTRQVQPTQALNGSRASSTSQSSSSSRGNSASTSQVSAIAGVTPTSTKDCCTSSCAAVNSTDVNKQASGGLPQPSAAKVKPSPVLETELHADLVAGSKSNGTADTLCKVAPESKELLASIDAMVQMLGRSASHSQADRLLASIEKDMRDCTSGSQGTPKGAVTPVSNTSMLTGQLSSPSGVPGSPSIGQPQGLASLSQLRVLLHKVQAVQAVAAADAMQALQTVAGCEGLLAGLKQLHAACTTADRECAASGFAALNDSRGQWRARAAIAEAAAGPSTASLHGSVDGPAQPSGSTPADADFASASLNVTATPSVATKAMTAAAVPQCAESATPAVTVQSSACQQKAANTGSVSYRQQPASNNAGGSDTGKPAGASVLAAAVEAAVPRRKQRWRVRANPMYEGEDEWQGSDKPAPGTAQPGTQTAHLQQPAATVNAAPAAALLQEGRSSSELLSRPGRRLRLRRLSDSLDCMRQQSQTAVELPLPMQASATQQADMTARGSANGPAVLGSEAPQGGLAGRGADSQARCSADTQVAHSEGLQTSKNMLSTSSQLQQLVQQLEGLMDSCYLRWLEQVAAAVPANGANFEPECRRLLIHMQQGRGWLASTMQRVQQQQTDARASQRRLSSSAAGWVPSSPAGKPRPSPVSRLGCNSPVIGAATSTCTATASSVPRGATAPTSILAVAAAGAASAAAGCVTPQAAQPAVPAAGKTYTAGSCCVTPASSLTGAPSIRAMLTPGGGCAGTPGRSSAGSGTAADANGVSLARLAAVSAQLNGAQRALTNLLCRQRMATGNM